jgi:hypothetical protein
VRSELSENAGRTTRDDWAVLDPPRLEDGVDIRVTTPVRWC